MTKLIFLHGFFGTPQDWDFLTPELQRRNVSYEFLNIEELVGGNHRTPFKIVPRLLQKHLASTEPTFLVGYSLGGRLALHTLCANPAPWAGAILISTHTGLPMVLERNARYQRDMDWSERFLREPWQDLCQNWNNQDVFKNTASFGHKEESEHRRYALSKMMKNFSLGLQIDYTKKLPKVHKPILWVSGQKDEKFTGLAQRAVKLNPQFSHLTLPQAGHRAPWDSPLEFSAGVWEWLRERG
jgi:2-succinyl-6-hydroxy-2,4-cyclohexadiene-1-carboxylate synthase